MKTLHRRAESKSLFEKHGTTALVFVVFMAFKVAQTFIKNRGGAISSGITYNL